MIGIITLLVVVAAWLAAGSWLLLFFENADLRSQVETLEYLLGARKPPRDARGRFVKWSRP